MNDVTFFDDPQLDTVVGLVFDLAAQLHIERQRRAALEALLLRSGTITPGELESLTADDEFLASTRAGLDRSLDRLMQIVVEDGPPQHPLRSEADGGFERRDG